MPGAFLWRRALRVTIGLLVTVAAHADPLPFQYSQTRVDFLNPVLKPIDPQGIAVSPDGLQLYVTEKGNRVFRYAPDGSYLGGWGGTGSAQGLLQDPRGITVDPYGDVYVADLGNNRVQKFTADGQFLLAWDSPGAFSIAADDRGSVWVLSTSFTAVSQRGYDGADLGGLIARFPDGYTMLDWYGAPRNTATAIAAGGDGALVSGTVAQDRTDQPRSCLKSGITGEGPQPLPDTLSGPAVALFAADGSALDEAFVQWLGGPCWANPLAGESFGLSGTLTGGSGIAIDPADGSVFVAPIQTRYQAAWHIYRVWHSPGQLAGQLDELVGLWGGGPVYDETASSSIWGGIRSLAIDCRSSMYVLTPVRILRYRAAAPSNGPCSVRDKRAIYVGYTGTSLSKSGTPKRIGIDVSCGEADGCGGVVRLHLVPKKCPRCRPSLGKKAFHVGTGEMAALSFRLPPRARAALRGAALPDLVAEVRAPGKHGAVIASVQAAVRLPRTLRLDCTPGAALTGTVQPAVGGTDVQLSLVPPSGPPRTQTVQMGSEGLFSASPAIDMPGAWVIVARVAQDDRLADATADCTLLVGGGPTTIASTGGAGTDAPVPGAPLPTHMMVTCPGTVPLGQDATATGALAPTLGGEMVTVTFTAPAGSGVPAVSRTVAAAMDGTFSASFTPAVSGMWSVAASWPGDPQRQPATAPACSFMVG